MPRIPKAIGFGTINLQGQVQTMIRGKATSKIVEAIGVILELGNHKVQIKIGQGKIGPTLGRILHVTAGAIRIVHGDDSTLLVLQIRWVVLQLYPIALPNFLFFSSQAAETRAKFYSTIGLLPDRRYTTLR